MGTGSLTNRSSGQVILQNFFNDIHGALEGDLVGRDGTGNPIAGQNCGNAAFPWGKVYTDQVILDGQALDSTQLESQAYKIVSGKTRSGSNQPAFLLPAGTSPSFSVLATSINLVLQLNGSVAAWTVDKTGIGVTVAPSTGNTATVNDGSAAGQASFRVVGEYGYLAGVSDGYYYPLQMASAGSAITARVGTWQAFKIGSEYFVAFIQSSTVLTRMSRGFFFDSSGAPIKRNSFSNGATITLMNLGYVFLDADGSTADTIFTGAGVNNAPTASASAPTSPLTGDYWYDLTNQLWKRYTGSSWAIVNRILVGLVVADATNCVAARSFDFFGLCRKDNTVDVFFQSSTVVQGSALGQRINVNGTRIFFQSAVPVWDTTKNLAGSSDRYSPTVSTSSVEYLYISDRGETWISDIEPSWRPDLFGWYHPYNPWRHVGSVSTDVSGNFTNAIGLSDVVVPFLQFGIGGPTLSQSISDPLALLLNGLPAVVSEGGQTGLKVVSGSANSSSSGTGIGFSFSTGGTGVGAVTFNEPFLSTPTVIVTCTDSTTGVQVAKVLSPSGNNFSINTYLNGSLAGLNYNFIAIGQRAS